MRTPLYNAHVKLDAKIVDFHGWDMPVWYAGIKAEHMATREHCGLFDVSHMGEVYVSGPEVLSYLNHILTIDVAKMSNGEAKYTFLLNEDGGIIDDLIVYCLCPAERYMLCINAGNRPADMNWLESKKIPGVKLQDKSDATAMLALQGPEARDILRNCLGFDQDSLAKFTFAEADHEKFGALLISRTGYTGSDGVEIFMDAELGEGLWDTFIDAGATPCGLGARDTLRLEMGYPLHGNDIDPQTTPLEAGLSFALDLEKDDFIGKEYLVQQKKQGLTRRLMGLELIDRGVPRQDQLCFAGEKQIGRITSGSISPVLGKGIALAYFDPDFKPGDKIDIDVRGKKIKAVIKRPPFVQGGITN